MRVALIRPARPRRTATTVAVLLGTFTALAGLSACGPTDTPASPATGPGAATSVPGPDAAAHPLTLDNCGFEVTVDAPPERVLTVKSSTTELMLALGLRDRVTAAAWLDGPVPPEMADAAAGIDVVSHRAPGPEAVLDLEPDMVFAGWESIFSVESAGPRDRLDELGILTYVAPSACRTEGYMPDPLTFEDVFADITQAGEIFGVPDAAASLVEEQRAELASLEADGRGLTALWFSSGTDVPYVGAGIGAPAMIMDAVGLVNVAGDVRDTWTSLGWEEVAAADPDVIVLVDAVWNPAEKKIAVLEAGPATAHLTAVREQRYLTVPFPATEAGVRNVGAAGDLLAQLAELDLP